MSRIIYIAIVILKVSCRQSWDSCSCISAETYSFRTGTLHSCPYRGPLLTSIKGSGSSQKADGRSASLDQRSEHHGSWAQCGPQLVCKDSDTGAQPSLLVCARSVAAFVLKGQNGAILTDPVRSIKLKLFTIRSLHKRFADLWSLGRAG